MTATIMTSSKHIHRTVLASALALASGCADDGVTCDPTVPNTICTIAGNGKAGAGNDGVKATKSPLYTPQDTAIGPNGDVWLLDFNNYQVKSIDSEGVLHTQAGEGFLGDSPDPGVPAAPALQAVFNHTPHMFFHGDYLYLAAWHNSRVKRIHLPDMMLENFAGLGKRTIYTGDDGPALAAALDLPSSVAVAPNGDIVVMDQANQVIRSVDASGNIHRLAGTCVTERYSEATDLCEMGTELVACPGSNKTTRCKDVDTACSWPCTPGYGGDDGPALELRMAQPYGQAADPAGRIVYDHAGNLIFADTINNRLRKIDASGMVHTIAGTGTAGYAGDGGPAAQAQINHPVDLAIAEDGALYFTDTENNCVRKVDAQGVISTVAGQCDTAGQCGAGAAAGDCFLDTGASCSTESGGQCFSGDGGDPLKAKLNRPYGIDLVGKKLYISDSYNNRIRIVNLP